MLIKQYLGDYQAAQTPRSIVLCTKEQTISEVSNNLVLNLGCLQPALRFWLMAIMRLFCNTKYFQHERNTSWKFSNWFCWVPNQVLRHNIQSN